MIGVRKAASVAADRSGNERAVGLFKLADVFANHEHKSLNTTDIVRLCDLWLIYSKLPSEFHV